MIESEFLLDDWMPAGVTGDAAAALGSMLLDDSVPVQEVVTALARGVPTGRVDGVRSERMAPLGHREAPEGV